MKKIICVLFLSVILFSPANASNRQNDFDYEDDRLRSETRYDYMYQNPPRQTLGAYGRYIFSNSGVRYVHSPSRLKNAAHAARINAYNRQYAY